MNLKNQVESGSPGSAYLDNAASDTEPLTGGQGEAAYSPPPSIVQPQSLPLSEVDITSPANSVVTATPDSVHVPIPRYADLSTDTGSTLFL